jgi:hypothetical protein
MGSVCTRGCRFCAVTSGHPNGYLDPLEPWKVAQVISEWGLDYIVLTSVARDDLPDGGAEHFAKTIRAIKQKTPRTLVEVLIPDFRGDINALKTVVDAQPDVIDHNIETVERLTPKVRDRQGLRIVNRFCSLGEREEARSHALYKVVHHGGARRDRRRDSPDDARPARGEGRHLDDWAVLCAPAQDILKSWSTSIPISLPNGKRSAKLWGFAMWLPAPWCGAATAPESFSSRAY